MFWCFFWRAIPDDYGRRLSEAKQAEKGDLGSSPNMIWLKLSEIMTSQNGNFRLIFAKSAMLVTVLWQQESRIHFRFFSGRTPTKSRDVSRRFVWKRLLPVWWVIENRPDAFFAMFVGANGWRRNLVTQVNFIFTASYGSIQGTFRENSTPHLHSVWELSRSKVVNVHVFGLFVAISSYINWPMVTSWTTSMVTRIRRLPSDTRMHGREMHTKYGRIASLASVLSYGSDLMDIGWRHKRQPC